ncbi:MAG: HNH endonuclease [Sulfuritalea sp.]|nr:HNH endonuclease [Sulfuritalea sp.]
MELEENAISVEPVGDKENKMTNGRWTREQLKLAFHLYCQLPFGKLHSRNPEIMELAQLIGRTSGAVAMKLVNFASLDPAITTTGRTGLGNASALDREIWDEFHADWEGLAVECIQLRTALTKADGKPTSTELDTAESAGLDDFTGETRRIFTEQRIKQHFFRRAVLSSYRGRCCMSGLAEPRLLIASHIVPWSKDKANRLNPSNGLCLSAIHDKAFDKGLIALTDDFRVLVSTELKRSEDAFIKNVLLPLDGRPIELPERFVPNANFIARHRMEEFVDGKSGR